MSKNTIIDLTHPIGDGDHTYKGVPPIHVCNYLSREESRSLYNEDTEFQIEQVTIVGCSGTYIDSPFHRYSDGADLAQLELSNTVNIPGIVVRAPYVQNWSSIDVDAFMGKHIKGRAVLIDTGWCKHFGTDNYYEGHPFLTEDAAIYLQQQNVALVGIDSHNIDDTRGGSRPVHTQLLGHGIPIIEHMTNLSSLPDQGFSFFAAPLKLKGVGTFPTRAYALLD